MTSEPDDDDGPPGVWGGLQTEEGRALFEMTVDLQLGDLVRRDRVAASELWSAMANIDWHGPDGEFVGYTFREAAAIVAGLRGDADAYLDWYCSNPDAVVSARIAEPMAEVGWTWSEIEQVPEKRPHSRYPGSRRRGR